MNGRPLRAVLVFDERKDARPLQKALADSGAIECELVEVDRLDGALGRLRKEDRLDMILVAPGQPMSRLVRTLMRAREIAPGVPVLVLPAMRNGSLAAEMFPHAAPRGTPATGHNGYPVAWAMRCTDRLQRLEGELLHLALRDDLTGLYNRRGFWLIADEYRETARRMQQHLLLFFADLDGLKQINDRFGHHAGDQALLRTAEVFKKTFRGYDVVARVGGDEFTALVIERPGHGADTICRRLQRNLAHCRAQELRYRLSLSVGAARFDPATAASLQDLVSQADQALYAQKRSKHASPFGDTPATTELPVNMAHSPAPSRDKRANGASTREAAMDQ